MNRTSHQTGSMGLHYVCYRLAGQGWHVTTEEREVLSPTEGYCWRGKMTPVTFQTRRLQRDTSSVIRTEGASWCGQGFLDRRYKTRFR